MTTETKHIAATDLLCAIFVLTQRVGRIELSDLRTQYGCEEAALVPALLALRSQGLVQTDAPRLTFVGLATALQLLPTTTWAIEEARAVA